MSGGWASRIEATCGKGAGARLIQDEARGFHAIANGELQFLLA